MVKLLKLSLDFFSVLMLLFTCTVLTRQPIIFIYFLGIIYMSAMVLLQSLLNLLLFLRTEAILSYCT